MPTEKKRVLPTSTTPEIGTASRAMKDTAPPDIDFTPPPDKKPKISTGSPSKARIPTDAKIVIAEHIITRGANSADVEDLVALVRSIRPTPVFYRAFIHCLADDCFRCDALSLLQTGLNKQQVKSQLVDNRQNVRKMLMELARGLQ